MRRARPVTIKFVCSVYTPWEYRRNVIYVYVNINQIKALSCLSKTFISLKSISGGKTKNV